jgi:hypothetical protein
MPCSSPAAAIQRNMAALIRESQGDAAVQRYHFPVKQPVKHIELLRVARRIKFLQYKSL